MPTAMPPQDVDRTYERFQLIVNGPALFNAIVTGLELDVFRHLSEHPGCELGELRQLVGIPRHKLRVLLHALCATELVERRDGGYANGPVAESLLATDGPDSWRHILLGWQKIYYPGFAHMTSALRSGTNTALADYPGAEPTLYQRLANDPEREAILHASMGAFTLQSMSGLLDNADLSATRHLLDVGGGDGTTAAQLATRWPETRITIFDMPSVTQLAERTVASNADRVALHPGDLFEDPFPTDVDGVLFSHVLEVFSEEQILTLLGKAFEALAAGGRIFVYGFNADDEERRGLLSARLSLYLNVLASGQGMAYPAADYERWLRRVGCTTVESFTDLAYEHGLVVGGKAPRGA
jgi:SAM-dependent methyltransferase